jgi:NAD(P)-dependent dehydrogenase (short-subunit alcohol dehydrogenase family)
MELHLAGKTALVTGGSAGIGAACARALYAEGVSVAIVARDEQRLQATATSIRELPHAGAPPTVLPIAGDLRRAEDTERVVASAMERFHQLDILVNNAGAARAGAFLELPDEAYREAWDLKLLGYIRLVRAVAPRMIARLDGRIVNIVGGAGRTPSPTFLAGSTANAALLNFTRGIARELAQYNVRINAVSPGSTATERAERLAEQQAAAQGITLEAAKEQRARSIPLGHLVAPEEIAAMVLLLVSDRVPSMTGTEVIIDGGATPGV